MVVNEYSTLKILSEHEFWALLKKVEVTFVSAQLRDVAESVCDECQGLPVAILALAGAFAGKKDKRDLHYQLQNWSSENVVNEYSTLKILSEHEFWALLKEVEVTFVSAQFRDVAESVCDECQGLQVAILALAGAFAGKKDKRDLHDQLQNWSSENVDGIDTRG